MARWKGEHDREKLVREVAREFEFLNPDIKTNLNFYQDIGLNSELDIAEVTADMIRTGDIKWDIILVNTGQYQRVGEKLKDPDWAKKHFSSIAEKNQFFQALGSQLGPEEQDVLNSFNVETKPEQILKAVN